MSCIVKLPSKLMGGKNCGRQGTSQRRKTGRVTGRSSLKAGARAAAKVTGLKTGAPDEEVKRYKAGDYFGELALMDNAPRAANIDAKSDITCLRIAAADFDRL